MSCGRKRWVGWVAFDIEMSWMIYHTSIQIVIQEFYLTRPPNSYSFQCKIWNVSLPHRGTEVNGFFLPFSAKDEYFNVHCLIICPSCKTRFMICASPLPKCYNWVWDGKTKQVIQGKFKGLGGKKSGLRVLICSLNGQQGERRGAERRIRWLEKIQEYTFLQEVIISQQRFSTRYIVGHCIGHLGIFFWGSDSKGASNLCFHKWAISPFYVWPLPPCLRPRASFPAAMPNSILQA